MDDTFPRQYARTQRFTLGRPRTISVTPDGERVVFLRSSSGDDPVTALWVLDVATADERLVADPRQLLNETGDDSDGDLPDAERARRERMREAASGITSYATDGRGSVVAFALDGRLFVGGLISGTARELAVPGPVFDPRPDPPATRVAYVCGAELRVAELDGTSRTVAGPTADDPAGEISWGRADFIAAEEMHRFRGYWWSPDGSTIAACRVDETPIDRWVIADPAHPERPPRSEHYPAAGTPNADVTLHLLPITSADPSIGHSIEVVWDRVRYPYVAVVDWTEHGLIIQVQSRDQRATAVLLVDDRSGTTTVLAEDADDRWVELVPGVPRHALDGRLLTASDAEGLRRLYLDGEAITPDDLQVRSVVAADESSITFTSNPIDDATVLDVWRHEDGELRCLTDGDGVHQAAVGGDTVVVAQARLDRPGTETVVRRARSDVAIASFAHRPLVEPNVDLFAAGDRQLATAVLLPRSDRGEVQAPDAPLPVLLDPYGGPHALRVTQASDAFCASQWFADQGFAVVVADGRGTPGRGAAWERAVADDFASAPLEDQVTALEAAAERHPQLDLDRVAIRGWSFGGYLAALAVLRRPDVFHAAIAGAPVTEWRLYDTHYTERYLGDPAARATAYDRSSLLPSAGDLERPLLLIHGLADDNVVAAHTLRLSSALLEAGRPHEVLPLVGVTHMTPQEVVAENLLLHQLDFLRRSLGMPVEMPVDAPAAPS